MNSLVSVVAIVPRLPPAIDGVGDYALNLARQLRQDFKLDTHFIIGDPDWQGDTFIEGFKVTKVADRSSARLLSFLEHLPPGSPVLLHYVGYGYAKRGCPLWLVEALEAWKRQHQNLHFVTMFHEISAGGPPWTSAFWLSGLQRNLAQRLVSISDRLITSKQLYAQILVNLSQGKHSTILALPVFSNIGEPEIIPSLRERERALVIFGSPANRERAYQRSQEEIYIGCTLCQINQIYDIGSPLAQLPKNISSIPVKPLGKLSSSKISEILLNSFAGFINYSSDFLAKSTIFAAYCSHGMLPIHSGSAVKEVCSDRIQAGKHYLNPSNCTESQTIAHGNKAKGQYSTDQFQTIANTAHNWYQEHSLAKQAKVFNSFLFSGASDP